MKILGQVREKGMTLTSGMDGQGDEFEGSMECEFKLSFSVISVHGHFVGCESTSPRTNCFGKEFMVVWKYMLLCICCLPVIMSHLSKTIKVQPHHFTVPSKKIS